MILCDKYSLCAMTADALQLLFAAPNAKTLLYPLVQQISCFKSADIQNKQSTQGRMDTLCLAVLLKRCPDIVLRPHHYK